MVDKRLVEGTKLLTDTQETLRVLVVCLTPVRCCQPHRCRYEADMVGLSRKSSFRRFIHDEADSQGVHVPDLIIVRG